MAPPLINLKSSCQHESQIPVLMIGQYFALRKIAWQNGFFPSSSNLQQALIKLHSSIPGKLHAGWSHRGIIRHALQFLIFSSFLRRLYMDLLIRIQTYFQSNKHFFVQIQVNIVTCHQTIQPTLTVPHKQWCDYHCMVLLFPS